MASAADQVTAPMPPLPTRPLRVGLIGIGVGASEILPAMESMPTIDLMAGADVVPETRRLFKEKYPEATVYASAEELVADPEVEAVWIATPNRFHAPHTILAANHGKHVVVEKPMAISLREAEQMVEAAAKNGVKVLAGHTQAYTLPIRAMRKIITSGRIGGLRALHIWSYSDWMLRPRTADELDISQGGGVPFRQGPHQIDTVRVLGGGQLRSVRAMTGQWDSARSIAGYYTAYLEFEDGTPCTIMHNGYGYFLGNELMPWGESTGQYTMDQRVAIRRQLRTNTRNETQDKQDMRIGGSNARAVSDRAAPHRSWLPGDLGVVVASCERGDMRHSEQGVWVYDDEGIHDVDLSKGGGAGRRAELEEIYNGVVLGKPIFHDARWGMATLEVCLAMMQSAKERKEIMLSHQIAVPAGHDEDIEI